MPDDKPQQRDGLRILIALIAGVVLSWMVSRGWIDEESRDRWQEIVPQIVDAVRHDLESDAPAEPEPAPEVVIEQVDEPETPAVVFGDGVPAGPTLTIVCRCERDELPPVVPEPTPIEPVTPAGADAYWSELASLVEAGVVTDTDTLLKMVDMLAESGDLKDVSRVEVYRPRRVSITDANRAAVVSVLRGE